MSLAGPANAITWKNLSPVNRDPGTAIPGSRLTGLARLSCNPARSTGAPSSKYVVYATACVYRELCGKITDRKKNCVKNYLI